MISHKIEPYKERFPERPTWNQRHQSLRHEWDPDDEMGMNFRQQFSPPARQWEPYSIDVVMGHGNIHHAIGRMTPKVVYAQWLATLDLKRGDWVVNKAANKELLCRDNYLRVIHLQEVQFLCDYDMKGRAMCVEVKSASGTRFWTIPSEWDKVEAPVNPAWHFDLPQ